MNNFHYAQYLANELYGVEIPDDKFEDGENSIIGKLDENFEYDKDL